MMNNEFNIIILEILSNVDIILNDILFIDLYMD